MPARALMVQGTSSHVGKSVLTAALCRIFADEGYRVLPFKAQNMSNNADVTPDGGEISRAQAEQARACRVAPSVDMNPILIKPMADTRAQLVVLGKPVGVLAAGDYPTVRPRLWDTVAAALDRVRAAADLVIIEGAGSPAEINLRCCDLVNMAVAKAAEAPVLLVGDIDRGGVFAHLVGTLELLAQEERAQIRGFLINKFRGDLGLLEPGLIWLAARTGRPVVGVIPFLVGCDLPEEDSLPAVRVAGIPRRPPAAVRVEVVRLPHLANFTDFDALGREPDVQVTYVDAPDPGETADAVILPGSQSTIADLASVKARGFPEYLARCLASGGEAVGICGGFQMLGRAIRDPEGVEATVPSAEGLGFLETVAVFHREKVTARVCAVHLASGLPVEGYEIHMGRIVSSPPDGAVVRITARNGVPVEETDGCAAANGRVWGTHLHGLFDNAAFRAWWLNRLRARRGLPARRPPDGSGHDPYAALAAAVRPHLDWAAIRRMVFG